MRSPDPVTPAQTAFAVCRWRCSRKRASKGDGPPAADGPFILRGSLRSRLRMTVRDKRLLQSPVGTFLAYLHPVDGTKPPEVASQHRLWTTERERPGPCGPGLSRVLNLSAFKR